MGIVKYSKAISIPLSLYLLNIKDAPILKYENLRFYEKYIVLALKYGIQANDLSDLKQKMCEIFNIKYSFVEEFIEHYNNIGFINYDKEKSLFSLTDSYLLEYDKKNNSIIRSCTKESLCDFINIVYFKKSNTFLYNEGFKDFIKDMKSYEKINDETFIQMCKANEQLLLLLNDILKKDSIHAIINNNQFEKSNIEVYDAAIKVDCLLNYAYDGQSSSLQNYIIPNSILKESIKDILDDTIVLNYKTDFEIPKYVKEHELYSEMNERNKLISKHEEEILKNNEAIFAKENILNSLSIRKNLKNKEKKTIKKLNKEVVDLKEKIAELQRENINLTNSKEEYSFFDNTTKEVYYKYCGNMYFDYMIRQICVVIDKTIEALSIGDNENVVLDLASIRSWVNKLAYAIYDYYCDGLKAKDLSMYFHDKFKRMELENILAKFNIKPYDLTNMEKCHKLVDSCYHQGEINNKTKINQENIADFLTISQQEKRDILLSYIKLYKVIDLTEEQKKEVLRKII